MSNLILDIETGGAADAASLFNPDDVKLGNVKDPSKVEAKIEEAREAFVKKAALSAETGEVLAVGILDGDKELILVGHEKEILEATWGKISQQLMAQRNVVGHNLLGFDMPFLIRRSWVHGVHVPLEIGKYGGKYVQWHSCLRDTMLFWQLGGYQEFISLDKLGKTLGFGGKPDWFTGAMFAEYWRSGDQDKKDMAIAYLKRDLELTKLVAERLIG